MELMQIVHNLLVRYSAVLDQRQFMGCEALMYHQLCGYLEDTLKSLREANNELDESSEDDEGED